MVARRQNALPVACVAEATSCCCYTDAMVKFVPTFLAALALWASMTKAESPWVLPITLGVVPAAFHVYLLATGTTLAQAQDAGWVLKPEGKTSEQFWELYELCEWGDGAGPALIDTNPAQKGQDSVGRMCMQPLLLLQDWDLI